MEPKMANFSLLIGAQDVAKVKKVLSGPPAARAAALAERVGVFVGDRHIAIAGMDVSSLTTAQLKKFKASFTPGGPEQCFDDCLCPLSVACHASQGNPTIVKLLLDAGCNPAVQSPLRKLTPLYLAAAYPEVVKVLLNSGKLTKADIDAETTLRVTPLYSATGHSIISVKRLIAAGATVDHPHENSLHLSIGENRNDVVEVLLTVGKASPTWAMLDSGATPLHIAAIVNNSSGASILIKLGKLSVNDLELKDKKFKCTPLMFAVMRKNIETAKVLLAAGAREQLEMGIETATKRNEGRDGEMIKLLKQYVGKPHKNNNNNNNSGAATSSAASAAASTQAEEVVTVKSCAACGVEGSDEKKLKLCGGCKSVRYCSVDCSKKHWKIHKTECKKAAAVAAAVAGGSK